jgi:hypothetical protein
MKVIDLRRPVKSYSPFSLPYDLRHITFFFLIVLTLGLIALVLHYAGVHHLGICIMWTLACLIAGAAGGFLFGIPKIVQNGHADAQNTAAQAEDQGQYQQQVNTNLTEISDWLTKIIIGLGLINLAKIPRYLTGTASTLANGIDHGNPSSVIALAYALIVCFTILGFLFGYITTRLFLAGAFSRADQQAISKLQVTLESTQAQVASIESNQSLINQSIYSTKAATLNISGINSEANKVEASGFAIEQLEQMANDYLKISHPDWGERVRLKDNMANEIANYALKNNIQKDDILKLADATSNEGLILALAMVINVRPEAGDFDKLMRLAPRVSRLHVRYKVLIALSNLFRQGFVRKASDRQATVNMINSIYRQNADSSLLKTIDATLSLIRTVELPELE